LIYISELKRKKKKTDPAPGILSTSNSTPSLANTNISFTNATGIPFGNNCGFKAIEISESIELGFLRFVEGRIKKKREIARVAGF
jgi:hypothetical protein